MGLDMYLVKHIYPRQRNIIVDGVEIKNVQHLVQEVIYWRKANAIHKWFVDNVQEGKDDCGEYYVPYEFLQNLYNITNIVLTYPQKASDLLSTSNGFFFGPTEYDEMYFEDLRYTKNALEELFKEERSSDTSSFYYHSSW